MTGTPPLSSSVAAVRRSLMRELRGAGTENCAGEADSILIRLLDCTRAALLGRPERILTDAQIFSAGEAVRRRVNGEPLQYVLGETYFYGRPFETKKGVLIPRPETELLVELALEFLPSSAPPVFLDWGTGSGCIAITLLLERPLTTAVMAEKNPLSLQQAWKNAARHGVLGRAFLWHSQTPEDIFAAPVVPAAGRSPLPDLVVSNPPYIPTGDIPNLMREVRDHEPRMALDGGEDGMDFYRLLFRYAPLWLKPGGHLLLEIGDAAQAEKMRATTPPALKLVKEVRDYAGIPRCMAWEKRGSM
ncbi:MAG: peptide chain release factor N(5)-glutamine methyltransferase [Synergistaceae bacterium]|jgi:release factor glutamine methyltransferase|nr:peptide chain release factor N(5)-glutamine methyltransferase [Synergistaceae bacterium]